MAPGARGPPVRLTARTPGFYAAGFAGISPNNPANFAYVAHESVQHLAASMSCFAAESTTVSGVFVCNKASSTAIHTGQSKRMLNCILRHFSSRFIALQRSTLRDCSSAMCRVIMQ